MIRRWCRLVLVQHDHHDRGLAGSLHITTHDRIHAVRRIIRETIRCAVILSACILIGVRCDVFVPVVVPAAGPGRRSRAGPVVDVVAAEDGWHRADRDHSAVAVALAGVTPLETGLAFRTGLVQCGLRLRDAIALQRHAGIVHGGAHRIKTRGRTPSARSIVLVLPELHRGQVAARAGLVAAATARERGRSDDAAGTKRGDRGQRGDTGFHLPTKVHKNEPPLTLSVHPLPSNFPAMAPPTPFQGMAGLPTAGITGGSHRMIRQPPTSLTGDTPSHGAQRLQKTKNVRSRGNRRFRGRTDAREYSFMGIRERTEDIRTTI